MGRAHVELLSAPGMPEDILCDLHVHIGRSMGRSVKITAAAALTVRSAMAEAQLRKGIGVLGIADAAATPVLDELTAMESAGELVRASGGGYRAAAGQARPPLLLIPGAEMELLVQSKPVHVMALLPDLPAVRQLAGVLEGHVRNPGLGCQRVHGFEIGQLSAVVRGAGGRFGLAHAFTPHKGFYGSLGMTFKAAGLPAPAELLDFVEMGLSADTSTFSLLTELAGVAPIAASDAHSAGAIGREMTVVDSRAGEMDFATLAGALAGPDAPGIIQYIGLDPRLGKYHRDACRACGWNAGVGTLEGEAITVQGGSLGPPGPAEASTTPYASGGGACPACGSVRGFAAGVFDQVARLAGAEGCNPARRPVCTAPYRHVMPLRMLPGFGKAMVSRLVEHCGSELAAALWCPEGELTRLVGGRTAAQIMAVREARLEVTPGGAGVWGRVRGFSAANAQQLDDHADGLQDL